MPYCAKTDAAARDEPTQSVPSLGGQIARVVVDPKESGTVGGTVGGTIWCLVAIFFRIQQPIGPSLLRCPPGVWGFNSSIPAPNETTPSVHVSPVSTKTFSFLFYFDWSEFRRTPKPRRRSSLPPSRPSRRRWTPPCRDSVPFVVDFLLPLFFRTGQTRRTAIRLPHSLLSLTLRPGTSFQRGGKLRSELPESFSPHNASLFSSFLQLLFFSSLECPFNTIQKFMPSLQFRIL